MATARDPLGRLYRTLLSCYPAEFRRRFGDEMIDYFHARRRAAAARGWRASARFWLTTVADLPASAWRERRRGRARSAGAALGGDLRQAVRALRREPALCAAVILLGALTVGATTTTFSVAYAALARPLPYGNPDRLVAVWEQRTGVVRNTVGAHEFPIWAARAASFDALAAYTFSGSAVHLSGAGDPVELFAARVTGRFFDVMGVAPLAGRTAGPADDEPGAEAVAVLGERLWRDRFSARPDVVGSRITLNDRPHIVVGVMPDRLRFPERGPGHAPDLWIPIAEPIAQYRGRHYLFVVGRLNDGVTLERANADLAGVARAIAADLPAFSEGHSARAWPLLEDRSASARPWLLLLLAASACLTLLGCTNIAGLLLARAERRRQDAAIRLALGASRGRLVRERLVESLVLSLAGGLAGMALAVLATRAVPALVPVDLWSFGQVPFDTAILAFALAVSTLTGVVFGVPAGLADRRAEAGLCAPRARAVLPGAPSRVRGALVVTQVALALVLTTAAGLFAQSFMSLRDVDPAFRTDGVLAVDLALPSSRYPDVVAVRRFYDDLLDAVAAMPGVERAAAVNHVPLGGSYDAIALAVEGAPEPPPGRTPSVRYRIVSDRYFDALRIRTIAGRTFARTDVRRAVPLIRWWSGQPPPQFSDEPQPEPVAVISETMARTYWPDGAIGRRFRLLYSPWITVVGVVADTRADSLAADLRPECYLVASQEPAAGLSLLVAGADPERLTPSIRRAVLDLDPVLPLGQVRTLDDLVAARQAAPAFTSALVAAFAASALLLMVTGIYGLVAVVTAARTPEIGLRVALGATRAGIRRLVLGRLMRLVLAGGVTGVAASFVLAPAVASILFGVRPTDPMMIGGAVAAVALAALAAGWVPATRASRIDPLRALRDE